MGGLCKRQLAADENEVKIINKAPMPELKKANLIFIIAIVKILTNNVPLFVKH